MPRIHQDSALSGFTRATTVDLINMLNVMLGYTELALEDPLCLGGINDHLHAVQEAGQRMQCLLYSLQELVRGSHVPCSGTSTPLDLLLCGTISMVQPRLNRASIFVEHLIATDLAVAVEDDVLIHIFASLMLNTIETMPKDGGRLTITANRDPQGAVVIVFDYGSGYCVTETSFAIAKIKVESNKGTWSVRGTTITLSLPLAP